MPQACLLAEAVENQVTEFTWLSPISPWVLFLVILPAVVAFVLFIYRRERLGGARGASGAQRRGSGRRLRWVLAGLRILAFLVLIAILAQPVLRTTIYQNVDSTALLLVDDSLSMGIKDKYANRDLVRKIADFLRSTPETVEATSRHGLVRRLFRDREIAFLDKLREKSRVVLFTFGATARRVAELSRRKEGDPPTLAAEDEVLGPQSTVEGQERVRQTRISDSILDAIASERGGRLGGAAGRLSGVVLFSDGQQTPGARPIDEVARRLGQRGVPLYTVGVGNPDEPKDIRVDHLEVNDIVLVDDEVPFDVSIVADGFEGERVRVELKFDGAPVASKSILLAGGGQRQSVRLVYRPRRQGDFTATVEVEYREGELFRENNAVSKVIKVLDQKIRVLYAEGPPRWEYRYLKNALVRDPTMLAQMFLFSADADFIQESSKGVPPLGRFPASREEIFSYHVIILGDVDVERALTASQTALLKDFVYEAGGGIVFVAGPGANPSRYLHTDLYSLIPVEVPETAAVPARLDATPITTSFNVSLTAVGREHEVMRLDNDPDFNMRLWENKDGRAEDHLPGFYWFAAVGRAKKGAVVLARHPMQLHPIEQKGRVIFAFMNFGKGRSFFSAVDNTWRWRAGVDNQYFHRFWGQIVRFCAAGRLLGRTPRYSISTDKPKYVLGGAVGISARVFDANMKPSTEKTLTVYHQVRGRETGQPEKLELHLDPVRGQGNYEGGLVAGQVGLHDVWIGTYTERLAFRTFDVEVPALERRDPRRNDALLQEAAELSGGAHFELYSANAIVEKLEGESRSQQGDVENDPLWDGGWVLLLFTCIIALEWILRKRVNLL